MLRRYLEIDADRGIAFHQPDPLTQFRQTDPPTEVLFCDCEGIGVVCHHTYADGRALTVEGPEVREETRAVFVKAHAGHALRRQVFVDVTARPDVRLDASGKTVLRYDEATGAFAVESVAVVDAPTLSEKLDLVLAAVTAPK